MKNFVVPVYYISTCGKKNNTFSIEEMPCDGENKILLAFGVRLKGTVLIKLVLV